MALPTRPTVVNSSSPFDLPAPPNPRANNFYTWILLLWQWTLAFGKTINTTVATLSTTVTSGLAAKLNADAADILNGTVSVATSASAGITTGTITWDASGNLTGGTGVAITGNGIVGAATGVATFTLKASDGSATFAGTLSAPSGNIGSFTIGTYLYTGTKTAYNDTNAGVHIGSDGIGIGNNVFTVSSAGVLVATSATISGTIDLGNNLIFSTGGVTYGTISASASTKDWKFEGGVSGSEYANISIGTGGLTAGFAAKTGDMVFIARGYQILSGGNQSSEIILTGGLANVRTGDFAVNTNKFKVIAASGNTTVAGTLGVTGAITGNLTGNASGTAATVTGAAQTAITSLGTLTGLTIAGALSTYNINADAAGTRTIGATYYYAGISSAYHYGYSYLMWQDPTAAPNGFVYQTTTTRSMISMHLTHNLAANKYKLNLVPGTGTPPFMYINIGGKVCLFIDATGASTAC